jgi:hypothetical protein
MHSAKWFPESATREIIEKKKKVREYDWKAIWESRLVNERNREEVDDVKAEIERHKLKAKQFETAALQRKHDAAEDNILPRDEWTLFASELIVRARDAILILPTRLVNLVPESHRDGFLGEGNKLCEDTCRELAAGIRKGPDE